MMDRGGGHYHPGSPSSGGSIPPRQGCNRLRRPSATDVPTRLRSSANHPTFPEYTFAVSAIAQCRLCRPLCAMVPVTVTSALSTSASADSIGFFRLRQPPRPTVHFIRVLRPLSRLTLAREVA